VIRRCRTNGFARAARADKLTLAALEATLTLYRDPAVARREIPLLRMLTTEPTVLAERAHRLAALLPAEANATVVSGESAVGGGSFPGSTLPAFVVAVSPGAPGAEAIAQRLRLGAPPVIARVADERVLFDLRTVPDEELPRLAAAIAAALQA
jgi:L-seryl-tRNA(Ser) seleniumtransferase